MLILPIILALLWLLAFWSALGCDSLRDYSYGRLETLCRDKGLPERFGRIIKRQGAALLAMEFLLTCATLSVAGVICLIVGWPIVVEGVVEASNEPSVRVVWKFVLEYAGFALLTILMADVLPWVIARVAAEGFLINWWPVIEVLMAMLRPVLWIAEKLDRYAHRAVGREAPEADDASQLEHEIRSVVEEGEREGILESGSTAMISRVMQLQDEDIAAIMTPRTEMQCVQADCTLEEARQRLIEAGHSRMPVIVDSTDDVLGILYAKDLLKALNPTRGDGPIAVLRDIMREPVFVPAATQIPSLLELMKRKKIHIAIVNDEYGGVAGLVTMEDILEEIVGEIADEYDEDDHSDESIQVISPTIVEAEARVRIDELNRRFDFGLPNSEDFDTIGGFAFSQYGHMPTPGAMLTWERLRITILESEARRIHRVRIECPFEPDSDGSAAAKQTPPE